MAGGRPELRASLGGTASDLGGRLYESLHDKLSLLGHETLIYPAYGAGSLCANAIALLFSVEQFEVVLLASSL